MGRIPAGLIWGLPLPPSWAPAPGPLVLSFLGVPCSLLISLLAHVVLMGCSPFPFLEQTWRQVPQEGPHGEVPLSVLIWFNPILPRALVLMCWVGG